MIDTKIFPYTTLFRSKTLGALINSPTWTTPTVRSSLCTVSSGGYYRVGNLVFVSVRIVNASAQTSNTETQYLEGFPAPARITPLSCVSYQSGSAGHFARLTTSGILGVRSASAIGASASIYINGVYFTED